MLLAPRVFKELGRFGDAAAAYSQAGDFTAAAHSYETDAQQLAASKPEVAEQQLHRAIKSCKQAKNHLEAFELMQRHPQLGRNMSSEVCCLLLTVKFACLCNGSHCKHVTTNKQGH